MSDSIYQFDVQDIKGNNVSLSDFKGKTLLIVNTASKCGFTNQYKGLEKLFADYQEQGLVVLGFPCNQFGKQEAGSDEEIASFCDLTFQVTFPMYSKVDVNGDNAIPLYNYLKSEAPGLLGSKSVKWNFTKFLVGKDGKVIKRFAPKDTPESIEKEIAKHL
jgi:glutathione peroxidase